MSDSGTEEDCAQMPGATGNGLRTDTLNMEIDLNGLPQLPAGFCTGTLYCKRNCSDSAAWFSFMAVHGTLATWKKQGKIRSCVQANGVCWAFLSLMRHWPMRVAHDVLPTFRHVLSAFCCCAFGQSNDPGKVALVHVCRQGRLLVAVMVSADGNKIASLYPQKMATFYLAPGYHELTLGPRESGPSATSKAEGGGEYFFHVDYERVVSATSIRDLKASLSMESGIADAVALREVTIDQDRLMQILAQSNPSGAELKDASSTGANARPAE